MKTKKIPKQTVVLFQEYDYNSLDIKKDKILIIGRILESGGLEELRWLFTVYSLKEIKEFIRLRGYRGLSSRAFNFWCLFFDIKDYNKPEWLKDKKLIWRY